MLFVDNGFDSDGHSVRRSSNSSFVLLKCQLSDASTVACITKVCFQQVRCTFNRRLFVEIISYSNWPLSSVVIWVLVWSRVLPQHQQVEDVCLFQRSVMRMAQAYIRDEQF